jgi:Holliday junction resolvasome RuvABC endonuclease subunit
MPSGNGIIALDLSLTTGWAYGCFGERPVWGNWRLGRMESSGEALAVLEDYVHEAILKYQPRLLAYEAPIPAKHNPSSSAVIELLIQLAGIAKLISVRHRIPYFHQNVGEARKRVLGTAPRGKSDEVKPVIIDWAKGRGWNPVQDDEADALLLLSYATVVKDKTGKAHFMRHGDVI